MRILAVGGGSGGHVTPVVAVLREIKKSHPRADIRFWCDRKFAPQARGLISNLNHNIKVQTVIAGKFRRYHHLSAIRQLLWFSLVMLNIRDGIFVFCGFIQSFIKLITWRPDVVFCKGGYVCLPVGVAAHLLNIPLVIHDSDAHPGLTNRILSRFAKKIATGAPLSYYNYPAEKASYVGIPISSEFHEFSEAEKINAKKLWQVDEKKPLVVVTGGGLGASRINDAVALTLDELLEFSSVILISGDNQYDELRALTPQNSPDFQLHNFVSKNMAELLGAADVVVTRAGATTILELAALAKPTIIIPNGRLTGGHQLKNAAVYENADAAIIVDEAEMGADPELLVSAIKDILNNREQTKQMSKSLKSFARPNAAADVSDMILSCVK
jgi:UDP-N-acetylglucosamine--N-acetylmuramyl-(pentapeptide) pyrophosphoryl-undecaprenol N-acetylglucosamine transferase